MQVCRQGHGEQACEPGVALGHMLHVLHKLLRQYYRNSHQRCGRLRFVFDRQEEVLDIVRMLSNHHVSHFERRWLHCTCPLHRTHTHLLVVCVHLLGLYHNLEVDDMEQVDQMRKLWRKERRMQQCSRNVTNYNVFNIEP